VRDGEESGGFMVRWDYWEDSPIGVVPWLAPNDSAFIGSYALLPIYKETANEVYLKSAIEIGEWIIRRGIDSNGRIYPGFRLDKKTWERDWLYVDAGFTMTIFYVLWKVTHDEKWKHYLRLITEDFIRRFYSPQGYFYSRWESPNFRAKNIFTRGQAWALDGMIAAYLGLNNSRYLEIALHCSKFLIDRQNQDGSWNYQCNRFTGPCNKATPILAYHFLRLYKICGDKTLKQAARHALDWCEKNQYRGSDSRALGGIHARNDEGCIVGVRGVDNIFAYANAYYIMALNLWTESDAVAKFL
jgi:lantibiotic modifying enzyme